MLNPTRLRLLRLFTGKDGCFPSTTDAKLRCSGWICDSINPFIRRALSSSCGDDDFSELGSPVPKATVSVPKLITEKPKTYKKVQEAIEKKKPAEVPSKSSVKLKSDSSKLGKSNPTAEPGLVTSKCRTTMKSDSSKLGKFTKTITTENSASLKTDASETVSSECFDPTVHAPDNKEVISVRITNINAQTTDSVIHSVCESYGSLEGLVRTKENSVITFFSIKDTGEIDSILAGLNSTIMNKLKWSAKQRAAHAVTNKQSNLNLNEASRISYQLAEMRREVLMKAVCIEDLEYLHQSLVHLDAHPASMTSNSKDN